MTRWPPQQIPPLNFLDHYRLVNLQYLSVDGNQLSSLPSEMCALSHLTELHAANNRLTGKLFNWLFLSGVSLSAMLLSVCHTVLSFCPIVCLFAWLSLFCLYVSLSWCLSCCLSIILSVCLSCFLSHRLSVCLPVSPCQSFCLSVCLSVCLSWFLSVMLSVCHSIFLSVLLSVLSYCPPLYLAVNGHLRV